MSSVAAKAPAEESVTFGAPATFTDVPFRAVLISKDGFSRTGMAIIAINTCTYGKDRPFHHGHAPPGRKKSPRSRSFFFFLLSPRLFFVVLSSRSYDDVSDDVTLLLMTWHSTAVLNSCTVQLYSTMDSMGTRARGWR